MGDLGKIDERFNDPKRFSFKDGLAVSFVAVFLPMVIGKYFGIGDAWAVELAGDMIKIILGGYFVHEVVRMGADAYQYKEGRRYDDRPPI